MALITTVGGSTTDSYVSNSEAAAYHAKFSNSDWQDIDSQLQDSLLRRAFRYINTFDFTGYKETREQSAEWPRSWAMQGIYAVDATTVPQLIKDAQCEAALLYYTEDLQANLDSGQVIEETLGSMTVKYSPGNDGSKYYTLIHDILRPLLAAQGGRSFHRVVRT